MRLAATDPRPQENPQGYYLLEPGTEIECPTCGTLWSARNISPNPKVISPWTRNRYCSIHCYFRGQTR